MHAAAIGAPEQFELPIKDERSPAVSDIFGEVREFRRVSMEEGGLITAGQAALVLGVSSSHVSAWRLNGRLSGWKFLGTPFVSAAEVMALAKERAEIGPRKGGQGVKAPSLRELVAAGMADRK
jgi:hypothetical protein